MLRWFRAKATGSVGRPVVHDDVLGDIRWDSELEYWIASVRASWGVFRIYLGGTKAEEPVLVESGRKVLRRADDLNLEVEEFLQRESARWEGYEDDILNLTIDAIKLDTPRTPNEGIIFFSYDETKKRRWKCDYVDGEVLDLSCDH